MGLSLAGAATSIFFDVKSLLATTKNLSRQNYVCRDKICLLRQRRVCCDKHTFVRNIWPSVKSMPCGCQDELEHSNSFLMMLLQ